MNPSGVTLQPVEGVKHLVAVGSGKGGVGKTTVSVNLAVALAAQGHKVGLMDADVYGPNVPLMMGTRANPHAIGERIQPLESFGVKLMSMGFMSPGDKPLIWRGPMLHSVMQQFLRGVDWGQLDFLIIDLPPGTGDVQLSLVQTTPIAGAVIVTTPSEVAMEDARKAVRMFETVKTPIVGLVENMSYLVTPGGERVDVFGQGGGERMAEAMNIPFLVQLPLDPKVRVGGDSGRPAALDPAGTGAPFHELAKRVAASLEGKASSGPKITLED
ncbi:MAG TPA: Mrp/NBP35 family ATP-binding protein [Bryobacteraceae bacterium]|nr:Mrp/NBP35 family ATP-binding protein [Bryobacteraceae bacterium]